MYSHKPLLCVNIFCQFALPGRFTGILVTECAGVSLYIKLNYSVNLYDGIERGPQSCMLPNTSA